jgi:hypothetical protein
MGHSFHLGFAHGEEPRPSVPLLSFFGGDGHPLVSIPAEIAPSAPPLPTGVLSTPDFYEINIEIDPAF